MWSEFGHPALSREIFAREKNNFAKIVNKLSVLNLFQFLNGDFIFHSFKKIKIHSGIEIKQKNRLLKCGIYERLILYMRIFFSLSLLE